MNRQESMPELEVPRRVFLSRNWAGDHYVATIVPPVGLAVIRQVADGLRPPTGLGWESDSEHGSRVTRHNDVGGDEGLRKAGQHVVDLLVSQGFSACVVNAADTPLPRSENGTYEAQNDSF